MYTHTHNTQKDTLHMLTHRAANAMQNNDSQSDNHVAGGHMRQHGSHARICTPEHRSKPSNSNSWGLTVRGRPNSSHGGPSGPTDATLRSGGKHSHNPSPLQRHMSCRNMDPPAKGNETLTHRHAWHHTNTTHTDTPRNTKPHTQTRLVTKTQPMPGPRPTVRM